MLPSSRRSIFWLIVFVGTLVVLSYLQEVLVPFVAAMLLAYLLNPLVNSLEKRKLPRWLGTTVVLLIALLGFVGAAFMILPLLQTQLTGLFLKLPEYINTLQTRFEPLYKEFQAHLAKGSFGNLNDLPAIAKEQAGTVVNFAGKFVQTLISGSLKAFSVLSLLILTPVITFYLLRDWPTLTKVLDGWWPRHYYETIKQQLGLMDAAIAGFIRGQVLVSLSLGIFYAITLSVAGLDFGFVIGLASGFISFIPYVGTIVGGLVSIGVAFSQFGMAEWQNVAIIAAIYGAGQFIEGNILSPKLVGSRINLHPVWMIFALFAGGSLFGFLGVLIAVPFAAVTGVLVRFAIQEYKKSSFYQ